MRSLYKELNWEVFDVNGNGFDDDDCDDEDDGSDHDDTITTMTMSIYGEEQ